MLQPDDLHPPLRDVLESDESLVAVVKASDSILAVSNRRLLVASSDHIRLNVPLEQIRRVEFDLERGRPATLVIVPSQPSDRPEVLSIPHDQYRAAANILVALGHGLWVVPEKHNDP